MKYVPSWLESIGEAAKRWQADDADLMAAAVSFYAALSIFPLLLVMTAGIGWIMQSTAWGLDAQTEILAAVEDFASVEVRDTVDRMLGQVKSKAAVGGPLGLLGLLIAAATLFAQFQRAFDKIWQVRQPPSNGWLRSVRQFLFQRGKAFLMVIAVGLVLLVNLVGGIALTSLRSVAQDALPGGAGSWKLLQTVLSVAVITLAFGLLFWTLPKADVPFRKALRGGFLTALAWILGQWLLTSVLVGDRFSAYGIIGSFIAVLVWIYYASCVVFLGAEYVQVICHHDEEARKS